MLPIDRWEYGKSLLGKDPGFALIGAGASFMLGIAGFYVWSSHQTIEKQTPSLIREVIREHNVKRPLDFEASGAAQRGAERLALRATNGVEIDSFNMGRPKTRFNGYTVMRLDVNLKSGKQKRLRLGLWGRYLSDITVLDEP